MIESFKQFRKRHLSNDPNIAMFALGACRKTTAVEEMAHRKILKTKDASRTNNGRENALSEGNFVCDSEEKFVLIRYQPNEIDRPMRCPHPAHGVIQDGQILKEQVPTTKRKGQLPFVAENELQNFLWKHRAASSDRQIFHAASAPEALFSSLLS